MTPEDIIKKLETLPNWVKTGKQVINLVTGTAVFIQEKRHLLKGITKGEFQAVVQFPGYQGAYATPIGVELEDPTVIDKFLKTAIAESKLLFPDK
jgi:hypothetical protein